uniref:Uncharacterized protein n=1 Tax=Physcomitrium patens TaxID=3218 RepID=A0A2K1KAF0_PHYPA|nr:hypothetical protein PHYPA_009946 [Physcomitrium patens]
MDPESWAKTNIIRTSQIPHFNCETCFNKSHRTADLQLMKHTSSLLGKGPTYLPDSTMSLFSKRTVPCISPTWSNAHAILVLRFSSWSKASKKEPYRAEIPLSKLTSTSSKKCLNNLFPTFMSVDLRKSAHKIQVPCNNHVDKRRQQSYCLQKKTPFATNDDSINYHLRLEYFPNASVSSLAKVWSWRGAFPSFQSTK